MTFDIVLRWLAVAGLAGMCSCAAAPPLWYDTGDAVSWEIPLVAPLDGAPLIVPATIHGKGPYLFALEPDQPVSIIDRGVAQRLQLFSRNDSWIRLRTRDDQYVRRRPYEVLDFKAGELSVRNVLMYSARAGTLRFRDVPLAGVLGADLLSRTIVIDVDRDRGVVRLTLTGHQLNPARAHRVAGRVHRSGIPVRKVVVPVTIENARGKSDFELAVDLGAQSTSIWTKHLPDQRARLDVGGARVDGVALAPFADRRVEQDDIDGLLGQDVLARYRVVVDQDKRVLWLGPRSPDLVAQTADRLSRWGDAFARCRRVGCVEITRDRTGALMVTRDQDAPNQPFEVVLQPLDGQGRPLAGLVRTRIDQPGPGGVGQIVNMPGLVNNYRVVDASPFAAPRGIQISSTR